MERVKTDEQLAQEYGEDWYERARWRCQCDGLRGIWTIDDMYDWSGKCSVCGTQPVLDEEYLKNLSLPF